MKHRGLKSVISGIGAAIVGLSMFASPALAANTTAPESASTNITQNDGTGNQIGPIFGSKDALNNRATQSKESANEQRNTASGSDQKVPSGQRKTAYAGIAADGLTFIENPTSKVAQQNPTYSSDVQAVVDAAGNVTGIKKAGVLQDYTANIPYWCDSESLDLCYRATNLLQGQGQAAALGDRLSIIDGAPHIIFDDENTDADMKRFLNLGLLQKAFSDWNTLLSSDFFLLKSQTTTDSANTQGKITIDYTRDYVQYEFLKSEVDENFWAASGTTGIRIDVSDYDNGMSNFNNGETDSEEGNWGFPSNRYDISAMQAGPSRMVSWGYNYCEYTSPTDSCSFYNTVAEAKQGWNSILSRDWESVLTHELGHTLGLDHPEDTTSTTYHTAGESGCAADERYYNNGPLMMEYSRDNLDAMLDGSLATSVQYRMVKDLIAAGTNYIAQKDSPKQPIVQRQINVEVQDEDGKASSTVAPLVSQSQKAGYYENYSDVRGDSFCGGFNSTDSAIWKPGSTLPAVGVAEMKGYEVSIDGGKTWAKSALIPAVTLPNTSPLVWDFTDSARIWAVQGTTSSLLNYGLAQIPTVDVVYRQMATIEPEPDDSNTDTDAGTTEIPGTSDTGTDSNKPGNTSNPGTTNNEGTPNKNASTVTVTPQASASKPVDAKLAVTGANVSVIVAIVIATMIAGTGLLLSKKITEKE